MDERFVDKTVLQRVNMLRRMLISHYGSASEALDFLLEKIRTTKTNDEFIESMNK
jgi:transcription termination factor Rho